MARPRSFDETTAVAAAAACFTRLGYAATSVDDLVSATGLHRGSLYGAFGSKRGLFVTALSLATTAQDALATTAQDARAAPAVALPDSALDLLLVAALELAPHDAGVRDLVLTACAQLGDAAAAVLGSRLLERAAVTTTSAHAPTPPPDAAPTPTRRT